jgi:hypothetical protein
MCVDKYCCASRFYQAVLFYFSSLFLYSGRSLGLLVTNSYFRAYW